jgi:DHA3 family macrolide efflux protein-like MFS transporter
LLFFLISIQPFFVIWTGQAVSLFGSQLVQFSLIWLLTRQTGSATVLAIAALFGLLPQLLLGPFVGTLVARWNRRFTLIAADALVALATFALAILPLLVTGLFEREALQLAWLESAWA